MKKAIIQLFVAFCLCFTPMLALAQSSGATIDMSDNSAPSAGIGWTRAGEVYNILGGANVTVKGSNASQRRLNVITNATVTITLSNARITGMGDDKSPLVLGSGAKVTLILADGTTNTLTAGKNAAGILTTGAELTINGTGSLIATGGMYGAGIGAGLGSASGAITISGGTVKATGEQSAAGIGGGANGASGAITISGSANVTATGGAGITTAGGGAGIGSGGTNSGVVKAVDSISINTSGTVTATGGAAGGTTGGAGAAIGFGGYNGGNGAPMFPTAPRNFTATPGNAQVALSWNPPTTSGIAVTSYQVSSDNGASWENASSMNGHTFFGLTNGTAYTFQVRAHFSNGFGLVASVTATPTGSSPPAQAPNITSPASATVVRGTASTFQVTATGTAPITYTLGGAVPAGVSINSTTGLITIAATTADGNHNFTITAANGVSPNRVQNFTLTVQASATAPTITSPGSTTVVRGTANTFQVTATGTAPINYSLSGAVPTGVSINSSTGLITIAATTALGSYDFTITATNGAGFSVKSFTLTVQASATAPVITSANGTTVIRGTASAFQVTATGTSPINYTLSGTVPTGVSINSATGLITIAATTALGSHELTITATNATGFSVQGFTLSVQASATVPVITSANSVTVVSGTGGSFQVTSTGGALPISYSLVGQPPGVTISSATGVMTIAATTAPGSHDFTIRATDSTYARGTMNFTLIVSPAKSSYIQRAYIAFFNRPSDVPGMEHWLNYPGDMQDLLTEFAGSAEYLSDYAGMNNAAILTKVYLNLFGREPDEEGLIYWSGQMDAGHITIANVAYEVLGGARNEDKAIIENKVKATNMFTTALNTPQKVEAYNNAGPMGLGNAAKTWLATVNENDSSLSAASAQLNALINQLVTAWEAFQ